MSMAIKYAMNKGRYPKGGGEAECSYCKGGSCMEHGGVVDRIMAKRMAQGEVSADEMPNEFDYLEENPAPHTAHEGKDYGDNLGNEALDEEDEDLVARIMRSRAKKDKMPRPA